MTQSKIEWTEQVWNPIVGCTVHSAGCTNCYAMRMAHRLQGMAEMAQTGLAHYLGTTKKVNANPVWTGKLGFSEAALLAPLRRKKPTRWFVNSMSDLFHQDVPDEWIDRVFAVMALCPQHTFQVLTKRSARMREYCQSRFETEWGSEALCEAIEAIDEFKSDAGGDHDAPLPNVWLGVSVEDQRAADERVPDLLATPAAVRWLSCEPLLGPVKLFGGTQDRKQIWNWLSGEIGTMHFDGPDFDYGPKLDWIVAGGESGPNARPMHPDWARSLRDQCAEAGVPFFFKQWGEWELSLDRERDDPDWRADYSNNYVDHGKSRWLNYEGGRGFHGERFVVMRKVGKKAAGRLLFGITHDAMPS